jgi:hypothetical protein
MARFHPGIDVLAALDLPFMDVRRVAQRFELLGDPERPVPVAARIADEDIGHARSSRRIAPSARRSTTAKEESRSEPECVGTADRFSLESYSVI